MGATHSRGRFVRSRRSRREWTYPPSPRLLEGILVPLVWVYVRTCTWKMPDIQRGFSILYINSEEHIAPVLL
jgi:hypothetical protein